MPRYNVTTFIKDSFSPVNMTLSELNTHIDSFLKSLEGKSKETVGTYQRCLRAFVLFFVGDGNFKFLVKDVERYKKHLLVEKKMTEVSMSQFLTAVRRFCTYLVETGILEKNPAKRVNGGKRPSKHTRTILTLDELDALLKTVDGDSHDQKRDKAIILCMLGCGLSELELTRMLIGDIHHTNTGWRVNVLSKGKTVKDESVPIPKPIYDAIQAYLFARGKDTTPEHLVFKTYGKKKSKEGFMGLRTMRTFVTTRLNESGVKQGRDLRLTPFSLRHTGGVILAESGCTIEYIMSRLRLEWRPTAERYMLQKGKLQSQDRPDITQYVLIPEKSV